MTKLSLLAALCIAGLFLAACGGNNDAPPPSSIVAPPVDEGDDGDGDGDDGEHDNDDGSEDDNNDDGSADNSDPSEPPAYWAHAETTLFLLPNRIERLRRQLEEDDSAFQAMRHWLDTYLGRTPYNSGEYAKAYALGYHLTGDEAYLEQAKTLLWQRYFSDPDVGWSSFRNRNGFRTDGNRAAIAYAWLNFALTEEEKTIAENHIATWTEYWLAYTNYQDDFKSYRTTDTDETVAIVENLTLFGYLLQQTRHHYELGTLSLNIADIMLQRFVVDSYMHDLMAGGSWAEGSGYSPGTQLHWMRTFLVNHELRNKAFPSNYADLAAKTLIKHTLAGKTGIYQYGSVEQGKDYQGVLLNKRYQYALMLLELIQDEKVKRVFSDWLGEIIENHGHKIISIYPGIERILYYKPGKTQSVSDLSYFSVSEGIGLISVRSNWSSQASNLYFTNRRRRVDHEHQDALNFDLAHKGSWITKQVTGYSGAGARGNAHNTILIENATSEGSSDPTHRALGDGRFQTTYNDNFVTIISADATDIYNMGGYFGTVYAKFVYRQLVLIDQALAIFDVTLTLPEQIRDLRQYKPDLGLKEGDQYVRNVTVNQLFQGEPIAHAFAEQGYRIQTDEMLGYFQIAWPEQASIRKIDGREYWAGQPQYSVPDNQRKWRLKISPAQPQQHTEVLTFFDFEGAQGKLPLIYNNTAGEEEQLELDLSFQPQQKWLLHAENGRLNSTHWFGAAFSEQGILVLFSRFPDQPKESYLQLNLPAAFNLQRVYVLSWQPEGAVKIQLNQQSNTLEITPDNAAGTFIANSEGLLHILL